MITSARKLSPAMQAVIDAMNAGAQITCTQTIWRIDGNVFPKATAWALLDRGLIDFNEQDGTDFSTEHSYILTKAGRAARTAYRPADLPAVTVEAN